MSRPDDRLSINILDRYLAGACDAAERAQVEAWMARDPARRLDVARDEPSVKARQGLARVLAHVDGVVVGDRSDAADWGGDSRKMPSWLTPVGGLSSVPSMRNRQESAGAIARGETLGHRTSSKT